MAGPAFTSIQTPQDNDPATISACFYDTLKKINQVSAAIPGSSAPITPVTSKLSGNLSYKLSKGPSVYSVFIPGTYRVAQSGGPYVVTFNAGGTTLCSIPIYAAGTVTTADDLFFNLYVDSNGNTYADLQSPINVTNASSDVTLQIGQTAVIDTGTTQSTSCLLHIACNAGQMYDMHVMHKYPASASNLDITLAPNNTTYSGQFTGSGMISSSSALAFTSGSWAGFYFDDMSGSTYPPYQRWIRVYTGDTNNKATALQIGGGGGSAVANTGISFYGTTWMGQAVTWTSLGTLSQTPKSAWLIQVTRVV